MKRIQGETVTRRDFLKGSAILAAGASAGMMLAGCSAGSAKAGEAIEYDHEADVVAIGGGAAGLMACQAAHDAGASTLLIEKSDAVGGDSMFAEATGVVCWPERRKADSGLGDDPDKYLSEWAGTHERSRKGLRGEPAQEKLPFVERFLEVWPAAGTKLADLGVELKLYRDETPGASVGFTRGNEALPCTLPPDGRVWLMPFAWTNTVEKVLATYEDYTELTGCEAISLIQDESGRVNGVVLIDSEGTLRRVKANKGVVIATGSFVANSSMIAQYMTSQWAGFKVAATYKATGDGIRMARAVGGALVDMDLGMVAQGNAEGVGTPLDLELYMGRFSVLPGALAKNNPAICVNREGKRFFAESRGNADLGLMTMQQDSCLAYYVGDSVFDTSWLADFPAVRWADTLEDLAKVIAVDPNTFVSEVERYNGFVESGTDADFGKNMPGTTKIEKAPYYAFRVEPRPYVTLGGIKTDVDSRVLDVKGDPIPGLYAAGVSCGNYWEQSGVVYTGGLNQALAFGYQAGGKAATEA